MALSVSPTRIRLTRGASREITVTNAGTSAVGIDVRPSSFVLDLHGKPTIDGGERAVERIRLRPRHVVLGSRGTAVVTVSATAAAVALPGDHPALVLFTAGSPRSAGIGVRMRIGVVVLVRGAGRIVHRLEIAALRERGRVLEAELANRGNVVERPRARISLSRGGHVVALLGRGRQTLLPHSRGVERVRFPSRLRGWVTAQVEVGRVRRTFRIRL